MNGNIILAALMTFVVMGCGQHDPTTIGFEGERPQFRHQIDEARHRAWFLTRNEVHLYDPKGPETIRKIQLPDWIWASWPTDGCMPDLALGPNGEAVVSSNVLPWLWRIDPDTLAVSKHELALDPESGKEIGFSGLAYSEKKRAFIAMGSADGSLWWIDRSLQRAERVSLSAPIPPACEIVIGHRTTIEQKLAAAIRLCVETGPGGWTVDLAPHQRFGHVYARSCS